MEDQLELSKRYGKVIYENMLYGSHISRAEMLHGTQAIDAEIAAASAEVDRLVALNEANRVERESAKPLGLAGKILAHILERALLIVIFILIPSAILLGSYALAHMFLGEDASKCVSVIVFACFLILIA